MHRKGARWVLRKAGRPAPNHREWDLAAQLILLCGIPASTVRRWRSPKISMRSVTSVRTVNTKRSAKQLARGQRGGILTTSMPASANTASNDALS